MDSRTSFISQDQGGSLSKPSILRGQGPVNENSLTSTKQQKNKQEGTLASFTCQTFYAPAPLEAEEWELSQAWAH